MLLFCVTSNASSQRNLHDCAERARYELPHGVAKIDLIGAQHEKIYLELHPTGRSNGLDRRTSLRGPRPQRPRQLYPA
jgi:hypothetical protein